jgi:hypothetical protein
MTREEWIYRYRTKWTLLSPELAADYFTPAALDVAYDNLVVDYADDPEGAAEFVEADEHWNSAAGLAEIWRGLSAGSKPSDPPAQSGSDHCSSAS